MSLKMPFIVNNSVDFTKTLVKCYYHNELLLEKPSCNCSFSKMYSISIKNAPGYIKDVLKLCHQEVLSKFFGCLLVIPQVIEGRNILDMGSGAGRDSFLLSKMVGEKGSVTGVDMMQEMLEVSRKYIDYHMDSFGFSKTNIEFRLGYIERLNEIGIRNSSVDIIVSNGVFRLTADKKAVLNEARRVLKNGGELFFSDMFCDRQLSDEMKNHDILWGECFSGAIWWQELVDICKEVGLNGPYLVERVPIQTHKTVGDAQFAAATYRAFKVPRKDRSKRKFVAKYKGTIDEYPCEFKFDVHHAFKYDESCVISANIADIIRQSRFNEHFDVQPLTIFLGESADPFVGLSSVR